MNPEPLAAFVAFCQHHIQGREKSDAQIFLDRFFQAFGHDGTLQAGARYEQRVKGGSRQGQTGFADLVWPERVLIEMKSRGEDLAKHWPQAKDYWLQMAPPPRYVILCNFDSFWIYDFHRQPNTPMDEIGLTDLPARAGAFAFMLPTPGRPIFHNNQVEITEDLAKKVGNLYARLKGRKLTKIDPKVAQRFVLQCVLAMFAEDRGLLPQDLFIACVEECLQGQSTYDVLGGLFREMNQPGKTPAGRYAGVDYFNGGLFATVEPVELVGDELLLLRDCARANWKQVRPAIFGSIFESSSEDEERRPTGMHYTSEEDILKIVRPTITRHWQALIDQANTVRELNSLQLVLQGYRVLDPACGSGNFLYVAYQELKWIEKVLLDKLAKLEGRPEVQQRIGFVTPNQFFGIDVNSFAVELARVTLMIARKVAVDELGLQEPVLPLDRLDTNVVCADALFTEWPRADAVIGNPPFLGGKHLKLQLGDEYIERVFARFPDVKDSVDFCAYWFRLAHEHLGEWGRAGLVGTNSISQGKSRAAALEYVTRNGGLIHDAVSSQPWSGEAAVHVSIVNWLKVPSPQARVPGGEKPSPLAPLSTGEGNRSGEPPSPPIQPPSPLGKRVGDEGISELAGRTRQIPPVLLQRAKELRQRQTPAETILWECLRDRRLVNAKFRRQHNIGPFIADFYCHAARLVVELDGGIHAVRQVEDASRDQWMRERGFTVLRFQNDEVIERIAQVLEAIAAVVEPSPLAGVPDGEEPSPLAPLPTGEGNRSGEPPSPPIQPLFPPGRRAGDEGKIPCYLDNQPVPYINSSLKATVDVSQAQRLRANLNCCFQGVIPVGKGFIVTEAQVQAWVKADPKNEQVLKLFSMGDNLASNPHGKPERWIIDFANMSIEEASEYKLPFEHVRTHVKPERQTNREAVMREKWWRFKRTNASMRAALAPLDFCFAVPRVSKWAVFIPFPGTWLAGDKSVVVASSDYFLLGILSSKVHRMWMEAQMSTLKADIAYTHNTCFETFPFPQMSSPLAPFPNGEGNKSGKRSSLPGRRAEDEGLVQHIRTAALELHTYRTQQMEAKQWGITKLYNAFFHEPTSQLHKLHAKLDALVLRAYGFSPTDDLLDQLLSLNLALAERERQNLPVLGPAAPHS